jgi:hypothetical protein
LEEQAAVVNYPFPWRTFARLSRDIATKRERSMLADGDSMWEKARITPELCGLDNIPTGGPMVIAANHYQRRGLWIAWPAALINSGIADRRGGTPHWLATGELQLFQWRNQGPTLPGSRRILGAVAATYGMVPLPLGDPSERAAAVHRWLRYLKDGEIIGIFPEGLHGRSDRLGDPEDGIDSLMKVLGRLAVPVIPVGVFENGGRMVASFGDDCSASGSAKGLMRAIATQLPSEMRGEYGGYGQVG